MNTVEILEQLQHDARKDETLRKTLLDTQKAKDPLREFCSTCRRLGYELYEMEVVNAGEEFYASMRRSTIGSRYPDRNVDFWMGKMIFTNCLWRD